MIVLGRRISINKLVIRLFVFEAFLRASEFFPAREGTRKSFSVADGLTLSDLDVLQAELF